MEGERRVFGAGMLFLALVGGAAVGAGVALMLAPKTGREMRRQIAGYVETAKNKVSRVPAALKQAGQNARETIENVGAELGAQL